MARSTKRITDHDKGYKRLIQRIAREVRGVHVDVGVIGSEASKPHRGLSAADEKRYAHAKRLAAGGFRSSKAELKRLNAKKRGEGSLTIGEIAEIHELGLGHNPMRSWLRGYVDENKTQIQEKVRRVAKAVEQGKMNAEQGMNLLGLSLVGGIRKRIAAGIAPPVTAATQKRKGPDKTTALINSGQFRSSITHKVETGA